MPSHQPLDDSAIKHLEFIQAVIGRLSGNAFLMKGWALTISGAFFGFSAKDLNWRVATVGLMPLIAFWGLDAYFLSRERMFRNLYDAVRSGDQRVEPFSMAYQLFKTRPGSKPVSWWSSVWSRTITLFYLPVGGVGIALIIYTALQR